MDKIKQWLDAEDKDYNEGLTLLSSNIRNQNLIANLSRRPFLGKLEYELKKVLNRLELKAGIKPIKTPVKAVSKPIEAKTETFIEAKQGKITKVVRSGRTLQFDELPTELQVLVNENSHLYAKVRNLHEKLKIMVNATDAQRKPLTEDLFAFESVIRRNWEAVDNYNPGTFIEKVKNFIDHKRINANRKYISTNKDKITENHENWLPKVQERVDELLKANEAISSEQIDELKKLGIKIG